METLLPAYLHHLYITDTVWWYKNTVLWHQPKDTLETLQVYYIEIYRDSFLI